MCIGSRCVQICSAALTLSHTGHWKFQHGTKMAKNSLRNLKDVLLRYMKIAKATRRLPTPWNWAAAQWLRSSSVLKERGPFRTDLECAERHIQMLSLKDWRMSPVSIAAEIEEVVGQPVSAQTIRRTLHQNSMHGCHPRRKPLLKTIHKKTSKQFAEDKSTKHMDYWNHVQWSDEMKINLFGSDGFKHVWRRPGEEYKDKCVMPTVKYGGGNVMV